MSNHNNNNTRIILLLGLVLTFYVNSIKCVDPVVTLEDGTVRGCERTNRHGEIFYAFRSISFAEPPVGDLRFKDPVATKGWSGILNATEDIPICYQGTGQEDCLYLSVFTKNATLDPSASKAVMVFFHGGGFVMMSPQEDYYNPEHLLTEDIVLVTAAYRLGLLGFLNLGLQSGNSVAVNAGMKDQVLVLKWVQKNIKYFGGDDQSVTIFGESAGACSVHFHMFSPLSKGLFHRVILESGSALSTWSIGKAGSGEYLAGRLNLSISNLDEAFEEMQKVDAALIYALQNDNGIMNYTMRQSLTSPVVEGNIPGAFLPYHPKDLIKSGDYSHAPMIIGINNQEGIYAYISMKVAGTLDYLFDARNLVPYDMSTPSEESFNEIVSKLEEFYFDGRKPTPETDVLNIIDAITDLHFAHGIVNTVRGHAYHGDEIYLYEFGANTLLNFFKRFLPETAVMEGASHMDELGYLFKNINSPPVEENSVEDRMIERMVGMWTSFSTVGNPTPAASDIHWSRVANNNGDVNYFRIRNDLFTNQINPLQERIQFWDDLYETYG